MLSALMRCWRKDKAVLQPAETTSQRSICISKLCSNSSAICMRGPMRASVRAHVSKLSPRRHALAHAAVRFECVFFLRVPPQLHLIPDKPHNVFLEIIKKRKKLDCSALNIPKNPIPLRAAVGAQALIPSVILSLCLEGAVSQRRASLCLDGAHLKSWCDNHGRHWFIWLGPKPSTLQHLASSKRWEQRHRGCFVTGNEPFMSRRDSSNGGRGGQLRASCVRYAVPVFWNTGAFKRNIQEAIKRNFIYEICSFFCTFHCAIAL